MPVRAPYAFVPLSDKVFFPDWGELVSHDVPFKDGWCGEIEIEIRTLTPLVVGAEREGRDDGSGEVRPYRLPDGRYAIPPSSLQGMLRNVLEIATFGRIAQFMHERELRFPGKSGFTKATTSKFLAHYKEQLKENADLPTLIFGEVAKERRGLRRRAAFEAAPFEAGAAPFEEDGRRILAEPKQTYWPCYLRRAEKGRFALSGWKQFPATRTNALPHIPKSLVKKVKVQTQLWTLPENAVAKSRLLFHNLRGCELGALIWALTWGGEAWRDGERGAQPLRHRLGMGRAFGLGQVQIEITRIKGIPNSSEVMHVEAEGSACADATKLWLARFVAEMDAFAMPAGLGPWRDTKQVSTLLAMADPSLGDKGHVSDDEDNPTYMSLKQHGAEKDLGNFLPAYSQKRARKVS